jgi:hypothetical protein
MQTKFKIIETDSYILAVSDEEIAESYYVINNLDNLIGRAIRKLNDGEIKDKEYSKIIAYQPKVNAPELDLPLLPEMVVEDDVEKLINKQINNFQHDLKEATSTYIKQNCEGAIFGLKRLKESYKKATKVYSEDDLREAIEKCQDLHPKYWDGFIQSLKQPKTPKWFVAEIGETHCDRCPNGFEQYLQTEVINGKTHLVGSYI